MNYRQHHDLLVDRARHRVINAYTERHHVIPRCLGGSNDALNIVLLTPEEHFMAHKFLVKLHPDHLGLLTALMLMSRNPDGGPRQNNKLFGWIRRKLSKRRTGMKSTDAMKAAVSKAQKGRRRSQEWIERMIALNRGKKRSPEVVQRIKAAVIGPCRTPEFREKISRIHKGRKHSAQSKENMRRAHMGKVTSEATKAKLSAAAMGRTASASTRANMRGAALLREATKRAAKDQPANTDAASVAAE